MPSRVAQGQALCDSWCARRPSAPRRAGRASGGTDLRPPWAPEAGWNVRQFLWAPRLLCHGIQRLTLLRDTLILSGAGVGGGSLVYASTLLVPPLEAFSPPLEAFSGPGSMSSSAQLARGE